MKISIPTFYVKDSMYCNFYKCSKCGDTQIASNHKYCPICGAKLIWGESDVEDIYEECEREFSNYHLVESKEIIHTPLLSTARSVCLM